MKLLTYSYRVRMIAYSYIIYMYNVCICSILNFIFWLFVTGISVVALFAYTNEHRRRSCLTWWWRPAGSSTSAVCDTTRRSCRRFGFATRSQPPRRRNRPVHTATIILPLLRHLLPLIRVLVLLLMSCTHILYRVNKELTPFRFLLKWA